tara:strand:+ start:305 stop:514 length:210 start_codon:yes stop_codon:yes gene_type:complete
MEELRGREVLKSIEMLPLQPTALRIAADKTGLPVRWHAKRIAQRILSIPSIGYEPGAVPARYTATVAIH